ncbi:hypothetical protein K9U40_12835 [Xanthobacter autotrophicus]|uniref:hypothetical protein n=1 Tax=Xanthobacter TaxID=279 RepID=UPI0024AA42D5|nr:hypothetical protein [Xanthobacter autotrophicus]MDI4665207.1 hypothetical protein [Xanthobacter autotrophicus]
MSEITLRRACLAQVREMAQRSEIVYAPAGSRGIGARRTGPMQKIDPRALIARKNTRKA